MPRRLLAIDFVAWLLTAAQISDVWLGALAALGIGGCIGGLRGWRAWRPMVLGAAALYLPYYAARMYLFEVQPLLAIVSLPQAIADAFYVVWSSPMGRLSHGEVLDALAELFRQCFMPLIQVAMLAAWRRLR